MIKGFDTTSNISSVASRAVAAGYTLFGRYLAFDGSWKGLTASEAHMISSAGGKIISFYETTPTRLSYFTEEQAAEDIANVHQASQKVGQPRNSAWYLTSDYPAEEPAFSIIGDYFAKAREEIKALTPGQSMTYLLGAYGDGALLLYLQKAGLVDCVCLAGASSWPGSAGDTSWQIKQHAPIKLYGLNVDPLDSIGDKDGSWKV